MASMEKPKRKTEKDEQHLWFESNLWIWVRSPLSYSSLAWVPNMKGEYRWMFGLVTLMAAFTHYLL